LPSNPNWFREIDITGVDRHHTAFIWEPKLVGEPFLHGTLGSATIPSFHRYGAPSLLKPSLAETLGSIRRYCEDWSSVKYFSLLTDGLDSQSVWQCGSCHLVKCVLISQPMILDGGKMGEGGLLIPKPVINKQ